MLDMFGDTATVPQGQIARGILNAMHGFNEWWKSWPAGPRKVAKQQCINKWAKFGCANNASHIQAHTEWLKTQDDWLRGFVPMPVTYLNQQRWLDWEAPVITSKPDALTVILAHKGAPMPESVRARIAELKKVAVLQINR
jgi:hypothetical protein